MNQALKNVISNLEDQLKEEINLCHWHAEKLKTHEMLVIDLKNTINELKSKD